MSTKCDSGRLPFKQDLKHVISPRTREPFVGIGTWSGFHAKGEMDACSCLFERFTHDRLRQYKHQHAGSSEKSDKARQASKS